MRKRVIFFLSCVVIVVIVYYFSDAFSDIGVTKIVNYNGNNLMISIDGNSSDRLPIGGNYYLASYDCKDSNTVVDWNSNTNQLSVSNGNKRGGVSCYLSFETHPKLSDMEVGSYVSYTGSNGCVGDACNGKNANYVSDSNMGYCANSNYKFIKNGWRIGYIANKTVYLISAGSPECLCTDSSGGSSNSCGSYESTNAIPKHIANLNSASLKYCNSNYIYGGVCNSSNVWNMNANDFKIITGSVLSSNSCYAQYSDNNCGYGNDLIDNGGFYWFAVAYTSSSSYGISWAPDSRRTYVYRSQTSSGIRPILRLDSNVVVTGGSGTYDDPYTIGNNTFWINDGATTVSNASRSSVSLSLMTVNATQMCISTNTSVCNNYVAYADSYTLDWSNETAGEKVVYVYYKDDTGNIIATMNKSITLLS